MAKGIIDQHCSPFEKGSPKFFIPLPQIYLLFSKLGSMIRTVLSEDFDRKSETIEYVASKD